MSRRTTPMSRRPLTGALVGAASVVALAILTGCGGGQMAEPTGDELYAQAEALYFDYRETTNGVQAQIDEGPWTVGGGGAGYGMQPSGAGCGDGWKFDLSRATTIDTGDMDAARQAVADHLTDAGFEVEGMDLGTGEVTSSDVIVREQGVFSLLTVTFVSNGNVLVTATTTCNAGDPSELSDMLFGGVRLADGYLPTEEAPSDPLFFGITPGDPQFVTSTSSG